MKDIVLTGTQIEEFRDALTSAFRTYNHLEQMLLIRLDKRLQNLVGTGPLNKVCFNLILDAQAEGYVYKLLRAARKHNSGNPQLIEFEKSISFSTREFGKGGLEAKVKELDEFLDLNEWLPKLMAIEKQVCRIEFGGIANGTGFLVAPDVVLTCYHVMERIILGKIRPSNVSLQFDYKKVHRSVVGLEGETYKLAEDWLIDCSRYSEAEEDGKSLPLPTKEELDYALLRLEKPLLSRDFIKIPKQLPDFAIQNYRSEGPLLIVQHPDGAPLKLAIDTQGIMGLNANQTRLHYSTYTEPGSSGSPCFNIDWDLIALHHSGLENIRNGGIPITALIKHWESKGLDWKNNFVKKD